MSNPAKYLYRDQSRDKRSTHNLQITRINHGNSTSSRIRLLLVSLIKILPRAAIASSLLFILQCVYVVCKTPRLPPPPLSGYNFPREGLVTEWDDVDELGESQNGSEQGGDTSDSSDVCRDNAASCHKHQTHMRKYSNEFRLVLIGDSPVEGIGNYHHSSALCGQTAKAFAKVVCRSTSITSRRNTPQYKEEYDCVRYWSFGKSGLTARGIQDEMVPLLHSTADTIRQHYNDAMKRNPSSHGANKDPSIHAIVVLCGVNNVLSPQCTPSSFSAEVSSLLSAIRKHPCMQQTPILLLGLPDFSTLPFLPSWPMGWILGMRGRKLQCALESLVEEIQREERLRLGKATTIVVQIPEVQDLIGSRGYYRRDGLSGSAHDDELSKCQLEKSKNDIHNKYCHNRLGLRFYHPLEKHLGRNVENRKTVASLGIKDFLCDDGFHPGRYGTLFIGSLLSEAYSKWIYHQ